ncbi:Rrf2 family transcriptional regulator [Streptomyces sp. NPDC059837]|uniref:Rrf2 family transcriptional regulator n=1 Tax=unclassified Streptomyces TaxID=2593676 RepID=UPI002257E1DE|nr:MULTISPECIES: Rrf2 family transcriptional regulator [unclassified Streptomyces]MCX4405379.1 Rrf2 family transcriptional regulator [Streptomyces sp. NBC_01764]MCX5190069.1 Rrf2 family transcriptional regulator [Streptomyces sp. NBC_00268]
MGASSRMTVATHALTWMARVCPQRPDGIVTSEQIAASVNTNPVVIRRTLGRLRDAGLVESQRGQGAGWRLARTPESITLRDVYLAVEPNPLLALHPAPPNQECPVGRGIPPVLREVYSRAEGAMRDELAAVTVADVARETVPGP